jgi:hypothetical protein
MHSSSAYNQSTSSYSRTGVPFYSITQYGTVIVSARFQIIGLENFIPSGQSNISVITGGGTQALYIYKFRAYLRVLRVSGNSVITAAATNTTLSSATSGTFNSTYIKQGNMNFFNLSVEVPISYSSSDASIYANLSIDRPSFSNTYAGTYLHVFAPMIDFQEFLR